MNAPKKKSVSHSKITSTEANPNPSLMAQNPPPPDAKIPSPPVGFVQASGGEYMGSRPRKLELGALPTAVENLAAFTDYDQVLGTTAPPHTEVSQAFDVAQQWSTMRTAASAWDAYCNQQEGLAWNTLRAHLERLKPAFALASTGNPRLATNNPGLASLLGAKKAIAHKAVATRRLNEEAVLKGELPIHGTVGKRRKRAAEKAALASSSPKPANAPAPPVANVAPPAPVAVVTPVAPPSPAPAPLNGASASVTNGAASPVLNGANGVAH